MRLHRLDPAVDLILDEAELLDLGTGVEAVAAGAPLGLHEAVALLPIADRSGADAQHALDGANAIDGKVPVRQEEWSLSHRNRCAKFIGEPKSNEYLIKYTKILG